MAEFKPVLIGMADIVLEYNEGQFITAMAPFKDAQNKVYPVGVYIDSGGQRLQLTTQGVKGLVVKTISVPAAAWSGNSATVAVLGITNASNTFVAPTDASAQTWLTCGIRAAAQSEGTITLNCTTAPTVAVTADLTILN